MSTFVDDKQRMPSVMSDNKGLSILIPNYNFVCVQLVSNLHHQAETLSVPYEIIVSDDASTDAGSIRRNECINHLPHCRYIVQPHNLGRACNRNFLANESKLSHLLFIDSDMAILSPSYLADYWRHHSCDVVYGGYVVRNDGSHPNANLRYLFEMSCMSLSSAANRQKSPYHHFHTSNFMIRRSIMTSIPFDNRFTQYGYEDVLLGKQLYENHISIQHIDNPLGFDLFEENAAFVSKTEESLRTLHRFQDELRGYNSLLAFCDHISKRGLYLPFKWFHRLCGSLLRATLCGNHPSLAVFRLYKIGYFLNLN
ncbi:MAG: glycosyltransferase family 2 protein [Prevotella sp.]